MIIDLSYFNGEINIPNTGHEPVGELLTSFINKYETQFLTDILGYQTYESFKTALLTVPLAAGVWKDLRDGKEYTGYDGRVRRWAGLTLTYGTDKESLIANYIYYWFMRNNYTSTTPMGESKSRLENASNDNPSFKMVRAWNAMIQWRHSLNHYLMSNKTAYPDWTENYCHWSRYQTINIFNI